MEKYILNHKLITNRIDAKIILYNCILYYVELSYGGILPVYLGMLLIFIDFQHCTWLRPTSCWETCLLVAR